MNKKQTQTKRGIVIAIVQSKDGFENNPSKEIFDLPLIHSAGASDLYYLIDEISEELEYFARTGKRPGADKEYHVFSPEQEREVIGRCAALGLTVRYRVQRVECADSITISYMQVLNPKTDIKVSLIPWFMVAKRPYPIFVYLYAVGHYQKAEKKSYEESAAVVRKLFGVSSFHKSTACRSNKAMKGFIDASRLSQPLSIEELRQPPHPTEPQADPDGSQSEASDGRVLKHVTDILLGYPSAEALEKEFGDRIKRLPVPVNRADKVSYALSCIPDEHFKVVKHSEAAGRKRRDRRKRPPRPRKKEFVQRPLIFIEYARREEIRKSFISKCKLIVLDAAVRYHRFLV